MLKDYGEVKWSAEDRVAWMAIARYLLLKKMTHDDDDDDDDDVDGRWAIVVKKVDIFIPVVS